MLATGGAERKSARGGAGAEEEMPLRLIRLSSEVRMSAAEWAFDAAAHRALISTFTTALPAKELEAACEPIVRDILENREGFDRVRKGPTFPGTPFDYFGFRHGTPYVVELKASRHQYSLPHETQRHRLQTLLEAVPDLGVALLQIKACDGVYRILYDGKVTRLFTIRQAPMQPIIEWVEQHVAEDPASTHGA